MNEERAPESDLRRDQVRALTCKNVVYSRACALECYFLGNCVITASSDGWCWCVCGVDDT